jgi:hypothetical protein
MKWLLPIGIALLGLWIGLKLPRSKPISNEQSTEQALEKPEDSKTEPAAIEEKGSGQAGNTGARLQAAKKHLEDLQKRKSELEKGLFGDHRAELDRKRMELERLRVKLKSRSGIGEKTGQTDGDPALEDWRDQRASELVELNRQLSELEARLHQTKVQIKKTPSAELDASLASLKAEHRILISRRDQAKSELGAGSLKPKHLSSKERAERKQWRDELTGRISRIQSEIRILEVSEGAGGLQQRAALETKIKEVDQKIAETRALMDSLER